MMAVIMNACTSSSSLLKCAGAYFLLFILSLPAGAVGAFDTFYTIDVSGSMAGHGSNNVAVIQDVKTRVVADIESRGIGDTVHISVFGGPPRLLVERTIQSKADKDILVAAVENLSPSDPTTLLYPAILDIHGKAVKWARQHPDHTVDMRIYSDGANNGPVPPSLEDVVRRVSGLKTGELPNLYGYLMVYYQPGDTEGSNHRKAVDTLVADCGFMKSSFSAVFLRMAVGGLDLGNARAWPNGRAFRLLSFYETDLRGQDVFMDILLPGEGVTASNWPATASSQKVVVPELNVKPRPARVSDDVLRPTLQVVNLESFPEMATVAMKGTIAFGGKSRDPNTELKFLPPQVPFSARIAPLRSLHIMVEGLENGFRAGEVVYGGIGRKDFIYADRGLAPKWVRIRVTERIRMLAGDTLRLRVQQTDGPLAGNPIARFVKVRGDLAEGSSTTVIDAATTDVFLRVEYNPDFLKGVTSPSPGKIEVVLTPSDEDIAAVVTLAGGTDAASRAAGVICVVPCLPEASLVTDAKTGESRLPGRGIVPPPSAARRCLVAAILSVAILLVLRYLCSLPLLWAILIAGLYGLPSGLWGCWIGGLVVPLRFGLIWYWAAVLLLAIAHPPPFMFLLGRLLKFQLILRVSSGRPLNLTEAAIRKGRSEWTGRQYWDRNTLGEKELDRNAERGRFALSYPFIPLMCIFIPSSVRLHVHAPGVERQKAGAWTDVKPGTTIVLKPGDVFRVMGIEYKLKLCFLGQ